MRHRILLLSIALAVPAAVADTYADIAQPTYGDSLIIAKALQNAVAALVATPSADTLTAARTAWLAARAPYPQSEAFRFGNPVVDDWEGRVNTWSLDEGLIDCVYAGQVSSEENPLAVLNVMATPKFTLSGTEINATAITPALISDTLQQADGIESNVAAGYHAIEFLLWGQDLNGTSAGTGIRPHTVFMLGDGCTGGNCDRRTACLVAATKLLVSDLTVKAGAWAEGGEERAAVTADPQAGLLMMLTGMGSLSFGELAGERMRLGLKLSDPEEEHDCFFDNTHNSHCHDGLGIRNVYLGRSAWTELTWQAARCPIWSQQRTAKWTPG